MTTEVTHLTNPREDATYWRHQVATWQTSGLSQAQFCKVRQLTYHRFIYWRQKLKNVEGNQTEKSLSSGFATVSVHPQATTGLSLSLPNGMVVRGIDNSNVQVLGQLLGQL